MADSLCNTPYLIFFYIHLITFVGHSKLNCNAHRFYYIIPVKPKAAEGPLVDIADISIEEDNSDLDKFLQSDEVNPNEEQTGELLY